MTINLEFIKDILAIPCRATGDRTRPNMLIQQPGEARLGIEILPFVMRTIPERFQRKSEAELRDTQENREKGLRLLRELITGEKSTRGLNMDDDFLLQYLRCRKFDVPRAFSHLKHFINLRRKNPECFTNFDFETISITAKKNVAIFLPHRCLDGCAIIYVQLDNWDPVEFPVEEIKRMIVILLLQSLRDPMTQINGFKVIIDVKSNPIKHIRHMTPSNLYLLYHGTQECVPGRFKSIHIVNNSITFKLAWSIIKRILSDKLRRRFHFHSDTTTLQDHFPRACLPVECGGDLHNYDMTTWLREVMQPEKLATIGGGAFT